MIENTIHISTKIPISKLIRRNIGQVDEVLLGIEFKNKIPKYSNIKISSAKTKFGKYKHWYFHINPTHTTQPILELDASMNIDFELKIHIEKIRELNTANIEELAQNRWLAIKGIGPKFAKKLNCCDLTFEDWQNGKKMDFGHKKIKTALYGKNVSYSFTEVILAGNPYLQIY